MVITLDNLLAHLPSHSSTTLLLHITLPFSNNSVLTLYPNQQCSTPPNNSTTTLDSAATALSPTPIDSGSLNIKIIGTSPFICILQDGTPTFQLQIMPALLEEHLHVETTLPECKTEGQILCEVVLPEYHEFADMFSKGSVKELPPHCSYDHKIDLKEGTSPLFGKIYNMSKIELQALKEYLDDMLGKGFICLSISAASALVLFAKKKDRSLRLCVDYWGLNKVIKKNQYPLPLIGDLVDHLCSAKIYTKIDLCSGYNNIQIAPGHEWKTAFCTCYGLFEYLVMPFGMTNSPATFQYFINNIFHDMNDVFVIVYLENILIYSNLPKEHLEHVHHILEQLWEYHLHAKPKKCSFHIMEVEYLGVIITLDGVHMDPTKVEAILNWPPLWNIKENHQTPQLTHMERHSLGLEQQVPKCIPPPQEGLHLCSSPPPFQPLPANCAQMQCL
ncbi:hypothetical protein E4T56_gene2681 [Termitomyces sp. T112]|nr:hypothetical protein E4T56_gene2681 [Termitomyces sp. T112]